MAWLLAEVVEIRDISSVFNYSPGVQKIFVVFIYQTGKIILLLVNV
jgi:hypothetical protein